MMEPKRLLEGDGNAFERRLLGAAREEVPGKTLENVMRAGIGLEPLPLPSTPSTPPPVLAPTTTSGAAWLGTLGYKLLGGALVLGIGAAVVFGWNGAEARVEPSEPSSRKATLEQKASEAAPARALPPQPDSLDETDARQPTPTRARPPDTAKAAAPRGTLDAARDALLREEIRSVDGMRGALAQGDTTLALARYQAYVTRFPKGVLRQEADALRIEAVRRAGDSRRADALAESFEKSHPESPHLGRVRSTASAPPSEAIKAP